MTLHEAIENMKEKYMNNPQYKEMIEKYRAAQEEQQKTNIAKLKALLAKAQSIEK